MPSSCPTGHSPGADTLATAYALACAVRKLGGADIILMGRQAIDGDTGQVGPGVAENLGISHVTDIRKIEEIVDGRIVVERLLEEGYARLAARLPVVLTVVKEINIPRLPSLKGKMAAKKAEIPVLKAADIGADAERLGPERLAHPGDEDLHAAQAFRRQEVHRRTG